MLDEAACEEAYLAIADFIDMRMPFTLGHSRAVASLATEAAKRMGLPTANIRDVRWAAYTHDISELTVPVATWMRDAALTERETDAARLHPYHGERALTSLGGDGKLVAALVQRHHERLDGSGYYRNSRGPDLSPAARILAAAEAFQSARSDCRVGVVPGIRGRCPCRGGALLRSSATRNLRCRHTSRSGSREPGLGDRRGGPVAGVRQRARAAARRSPTGRAFAGCRRQPWRRAGCCRCPAW